jgi:predicted GIY-YIG superfamily endonuclease
MKKNKPPGYWTLAKIEKLAKKYKTKTEFKKEHPDACSAAYRKKWMKKIDKYFTQTRKPSGYWSKGRLKKIAKAYKTRTEFKKGSGSAYSIAYKNGWLDEICKEYKSKYKPNGYWTFERIEKVAKKFESETEFRKQERNLHTYAYRKGWISRLEKHFSLEKKKENNYWDFDKILEASEECKTKKEFRDKYPSAHQAAWKLGIFNEVTKDMSLIVGNRYIRLLYVFEFPDKSAYIGLTYNYDKRYDFHMRFHKEIISKTNKMGHDFIMYNEQLLAEKAAEEEIKLIEKYRKKGWNILNHHKGGGLGGGHEKWTFEEVEKEAKKYKTIKNFKKNAPKACNAAYRKGWMDRLRVHFMELKKPNGYWTKKKILEVTKLCKTKKEFRDNHLNAFKAAIRLECLDEVQAKLKGLPTPRGHWNIFENVAKEAKKYKNRTEFMKNASGAYDKARDKGWLDKVCKHMKKTSQKY